MTVSLGEVEAKKVTAGKRKQARLYRRFSGRAVGVAVHGSSGHGCFGYRPRNSFLTSG